MVQIFENQNTQDVLPFKGKITTVMYYEPETGFAIFKIRQEGETKSSTAKGYVPNPVAGAKIYYNGTWKEDQKFGGYYIAISNSKIDYAGGGKDAIIELLSSDFVPGVGPTVAKKIVDHFGKDALRVIEREPERLKEISGIGVKSADRIHEGYMHIANDQELIALLLPYLSIQKINSVIKKFGTGKMALEEIKENPYVLYQKFSGIGFATADKVALEHPASTIQSAYYSVHGDCEASIIVVDEFSMCNLETAHMVFELASHGCKLVIVGDPDQLPAIGAGNVLRDLIQSGVVNVCKLSSCHRNVGSIVENAIHINTGETTETFKQDEQFALIPAKGKEMRNIALSNYFAYVEKYGEQVTEKNADTAEVYEEGIKQVCLLTPTKKKGCGSLSATDMNLLIRDELNPATDANSWFFSNFKKKAKPEQGFEYRLGDRVMLCKNHKNSFVNGDMGFIVDYQEKALDPNTSGTIHHAYTIRFDNPCDVEGRVYTMLVSRKTLQSEFSLAYAMTVHKSQGSEFKAVVIGLEKSWSRLLQRNLLYTAVTRAKKECRIIGEMKTVDEAILTNDIEYRNTLLESRLTHFDRERYETIHRRNVEDDDSDWRDDDD